MPEPFRIVTVQPQWVLDDEVMGTKSKFWYRDSGVDVEWLFKYPQENTGQHWAEKIAAEAANLLRIPHGRVELAEFEEKRGSVTESFVGEGWELRHGNEILVIMDSDYDPDQRFRQSRHTLDNIWSALDRIHSRVESAHRAKLQFADYLVLDALIGNTDRHHENWGYLVPRVEDGIQGSLAPSFDHASSLGRELLDERRDKLLTEDRVGEYSERGRGGVYRAEDEKHGPSPVELVRRAADFYPELLHPALVYRILNRSNYQLMINQRVIAPGEAW